MAQSSSAAEDTPDRGWPLEPDREEMERLLRAVAERVIDHVGSLPEQPTDGTERALETARKLRGDPPGSGRPIEETLELLFEELVPRSLNAASPGYLAYIPGGGAYTAALGAYVAKAVNRYVGVFAAAPALAQLEADVVRWFSDIVGYPESARGFLTTGGSLANFTGVITAREEKLPGDFLQGVIYVSDQVHHSVAKAARLAGFPPEAVQPIGTDSEYRMMPGELRQAVEADRARRRRPFLVVASAGTTNTGAVDPLPAIADLAAEESLWLHVDASYGGLFRLTGRGDRILTGLERADTVVLDPHKTFFMPYGVGCLLARDGGALRRAHSLSADYMPPMQEDPEFVDFCEVSPELSREFRGLGIWLSVMTHGLDAFREALDEKLDLAAWTCERLAELEDVDIVARPQLTVIAWRLRPPGVEDVELDRLNERLMRAINRRQRVFLTGTRLQEGFVIRICIVSHRTHRERMEMALADVREAIAEVRSGG